MAKYVIIGNGVAGVSAAEKIIQTDSDCVITMFSEETDAFYYRPRLPEFLAGEAELEAFTLKKPSWYADNNIDLRLGEKVVGVDHESRRVKTSKGGEVEYDALLLATGGRSFIPPVPGSDQQRVYALRSAADARLIREAAQKTDKAILIGGGLLGLEAGAALAGMGLKVQVVEMFDRLLPRQLDYRGAARLQGLLEGMGFSFYLGDKSVEITGAEGTADGLLLESGAKLEAGLVLFSAGIRGNVDLAKEMGLTIDKGLVVDDGMQTSLEGVWAAGDQIEHRGRLYGIWPASQAQGRIAGINMAGGAAVYEGTVMGASLKVVGVDLTSVGEIDVEEKYSSAVYEEENVYRKIVVNDGKIVGFIFFGLTDGIKECKTALESGTDVGALFDEMNNKDFDFSKLIG